MSINSSTNASTNADMSTFTPIHPSQELLDSLRSAWEEQQALEWEQEEEILEDEHRYREYAIQEEEKKQNAILLETPPRLERQDTIVLGHPPILRRERPEDYLFDPNSFISPDRVSNIQMPVTPVANRTSYRDLSHIRPLRLNFNN